MANSGSSVSQTILYLRPGTPEDIEVLDIPNNELYNFKVTPPPEPVDTPLDGIPELLPTTHLSPYDNSSHNHGRVSRESTPGMYPSTLRVIRLGFESTAKLPARGFEFGSAPSSDVKVPYYGTQTIKAYFRIHYNFNSGALLITALDRIRVGSAVLRAQKSLLLMAGTSIHCGEKFQFIVEFPNISTCAKEHQFNYEQYAKRLGFPDAQYMATTREDDPQIGAEHKSSAILGKGAFGEVHKAVNIKDGKVFAIKILSGDGNMGMKEINIMSSLCHENIIKYERAFKIPTGQICIVMELAVSDLDTQRKARQNSKRNSYLSLPCVRSIGRQALSGLKYLHGEGFMHRDLKPQNILVTKWDPETDIPAIKLADFGLAGINSEHKTFCGTDGYIAPEVIEVNKRTEELQKQKRKGIETVAQDQRLVYTNAIDIWALGKVFQELILDIPSSLRGRMVLGTKEPALSLIDRMMQDKPERRPTAAECLKDPWMASNISSDSLPAQKRDRSSTSSTSSARQPFRKMNHQQKPIEAPDQFSMPTTALNEGAITNEALSVPQQTVSSIENDSSWGSEATNGVTYPSNYDDVTADMSY
ncbi:MAG: hypothetical protein M1834_006902 [Cirrosporium novae-zelandiae]|nr:MAG: hypothetical protein M1834_006902 [Cirrosporium novae-zelandiae]